MIELPEYLKNYEKGDPDPDLLGSNDILLLILRNLEKLNERI